MLITLNIQKKQGIPWQLLKDIYKGSDYTELDAKDMHTPLSVW
jgi:hypothetical protein